MRSANVANPTRNKFCRRTLGENIAHTIYFILNESETREIWDREWYTIEIGK